MQHGLTVTTSVHIFSVSQCLTQCQIEIGQEQRLHAALA
jgi:hypothetical protein